ncbi:DNA cytosine methyltransferase [Lacrimispora sphenoides]|uniref:DNA (cytosine-5-)-methyltransferase n=1 Tax=Lacrimispora sphenoides JCM 1415 TaxID=1297793 RepID=A0ABY1CGV8_9FIRM|nr:DNA cytosine methyltransferase [Lacrimispora sphenoides]SEU03578.1 DNA (cytosine-5)-methyltransferase 1 [[Clostridium] sphenoides JCM 1415]SUY48792.1 DNA-cytosine methyltransferase [Lacrimispora sphenoides]
MRVADFFCGGGGFSEGFRQAGFKISFAVDKWKPAVDTFKANKPEAKVILDDVIRLSNLPEEEFEAIIPDTEVIIGSPPCVAFSNSNKSGNGDKELGISLLEAYLKIIARKKFKENSILIYWALENVPNIKEYIKYEYRPSDFGLTGDWVLRPLNDLSKIYNAKYYGAPTNRKRFLCGEFPELVETHNDDTVVPLKAVLESLGDPTDFEDIIIWDCNYPELGINSHMISDHHYEHVLQRFEWEAAKRLKQDKGYMGRMSFPENPDNPARTVMATLSSSSRESMILGRKNGGYRLPTVREVACMMSFPNDYRFCGTTEGTKYRLVGNAVPPKLSYALAKAIMIDLGESVPSNYIKIKYDLKVPFVDLNNANIPPKTECSKRATAKFKYHIPYLIYSAYRVELTNYNSDFKSLQFKWNVEIHYSQGKKKANKFMPVPNIEFLDNYKKENIEKFIKSMQSELVGYNDFQKRYCMTSLERNNMLGPYELLSRVREFIDEVYPTDEFRANIIRISEMPYELPISIVVGYYILCRLVENMGDKIDGYNDKESKTY